jgi:hypothetical protein
MDVACLCAVGLSLVLLRGPQSDDFENKIPRSVAVGADTFFLSLVSECNGLITAVVLAHCES